MAARDPPPLDERLVQDAVIAQMLKEDPDHVFRVLTEIVERLKDDGRYSREEIEAAAVQLCRELGFPPSVN